MRSVCLDHPKYTAGCPHCAARSRAYRSSRKAALAAGSWERLLRGNELAPVVAHVRALLVLEGASGILISERAGVSNHTVYRLRDGRQRTLHPALAEAIMGVRPVDLRSKRAVPTSPGARVDATGAARRLQALMADNWDTPVLASICGAGVSELSRWRRHTYPQISLANHLRIKELFDKIQSLADPRGQSRTAATHAQRLGYLPPERWDDDEIDNPGAEPLPPEPDTPDHVEVRLAVADCLNNPREGKAAGLPLDIKREITRHALGRLGWPQTRVAWLLGYKSPGQVGYLLRGRADRRESE